MFHLCLRFQGLGIGTWDTSSVTKMNAMFYYCNSFTGQGISAWDTSLVKDMTYMFGFCETFDHDLSARGVITLVLLPTSTILELSQRRRGT